MEYTVRQTAWQAAIQQSVKAIEAEDKDCRVLDLAAGAGHTFCFCHMHLDLLICAFNILTITHQSSRPGKTNTYITPVLKQVNRGYCFHFGGQPVTVYLGDKAAQKKAAHWVAKEINSEDNSNLAFIASLLRSATMLWLL